MSALDGTHRYRFNEAGADAPEILHFRASGRGFTERFNEAGADAPEIRLSGVSGHFNPVQLQ